MNPIVPFITLLVGWLLGLVGPTIQDKLRNYYRVKRICRSIVLEFAETRNECLMVSFLIDVQTGQLTKEKFRRVRDAKVRIFTTEAAKFEKALKNLDALDDKTFQALFGEVDNTNKGSGINLRMLAVPYAQSKIADLEYLSEEGRRTLLELLSRIRIFNQLVEDSRNYWKMSYDTKLVDEQQESLRKQRNDAYRIAAAQSERIVELVILGTKALEEFANAPTVAALVLRRIRKVSNDFYAKAVGWGRRFMTR